MAATVDFMVYRRDQTEPLPLLVTNLDSAVTAFKSTAAATEMEDMKNAEMKLYSWGIDCYFDPHEKSANSPIKERVQKL